MTVRIYMEDGTIEDMQEVRAVHINGKGTIVDDDNDNVPNLNFLNSLASQIKVMGGTWKDTDANQKNNECKGSVENYTGEHEK